ncbi:MAG: glutamine synthetase family protein [bacterium]|nr:glutamine synthetase family protein [bacterium]
MSQKHTPESVLKFVKDNEIESIWHWFVDLEGQIKGFSITPSELDRSLEDGMHFDGSSISGFNAIEESDLVAKPDLSTFVELPDFSHIDGSRPTPRSVAYYCNIETPDGKPYDRDSRAILRRVTEQAKEMGYDTFMGPELEFFIFASSQFPELLDNGGYFTGPPVDLGGPIRNDIIKALQALGITVEYSHHEVAPSQHEIDLRYDETNKIADAATTYKYIVKQVAHAHGAYATFMPKPIFGINGSGMHVHMSLWQDGKNAFADSAAPDGLSTIAKQYIAGVLKYAQECCSFWAPTVNSYKRLVPGYEAPVYIAWSLRNRSALIRVPAFTPGREKSVRMELRCADPSANPYLAFATMLGAGLQGIREGLELEPAQVDNLYHLSELERERRGIKNLPGNLHEALHHTKKSTFLRGLLGDNLVNNYLEIKYKEYDEYRVRVSDWEIERYYSIY